MIQKASDRIITFFAGDQISKENVELIGQKVIQFGTEISIFVIKDDCQIPDHVSYMFCNTKEEAKEIYDAEFNTDIELDSLINLLEHPSVIEMMEDEKNDLKT